MNVVSTTIGKQRRRKRGRLYLTLSWLVARLWWGLEISRLSILRIRPRAVIHRVAREQRAFSASEWVVEEDAMYCVGVDRLTPEIVVRQLPPLDSN